MNTFAMMLLVASLAGEGAKNCASPLPDMAAPGSISEPCLVNAFRNKTAAYWEVNQMAVTSAGVVYLGEYRCAKPSIVREFGKERLRCLERYEAPFRADQLPMRVSAPVRAPRPRSEIRIPAKICDPAGPGRMLQIELIVDTTGKVLMADLLVVPKQCDIRALETHLRGLQLEPGTLDGAPVLTSWFTIVHLQK